MESPQVARSSADDAYQAIRRLIVTTELLPGTPFTENDLARRVVLGKTPVREALLRLKIERLVVVQTRAGYRVAPVTLKNVRDTCRLLALVEPPAAENAGARPERLVRVEAAAERAEAALAEPGDEWLRADWQFHLELARCQDNESQTHVLDRLHQEVLRFRYLARGLGASTAELTHPHDDLLEAIRSREAGRARSSIESLWRQAESALVLFLSTAGPLERVNIQAVQATNSFYLDPAPSDPVADDVFGHPRGVNDRLAAAVDATGSVSS